MPDDWKQRIESMGANLLSLEVNTIVKNGIGAQKMPELPVALHVLAETYALYLQNCRFPITDYLVRAAASRIVDYERESEHFRLLMESWPFSHNDVPNWQPPGWPANWPALDRPLDSATNGAETFEALQWAAAHAARSEALRPAPDPRREALLGRIRSSSRQLKEAANMLEQQFSAGPLPALQESAETFAERLLACARAAPREAEIRRSRLFGGTLEQTARALFRHPRPSLSLAPDITVLVRKSWDVGLEEVMYQTVLQLDGDVLVRVAEIADPALRDFLGQLHRGAVEDGTRQWHLLFRIAGELVGSLGRSLFSRSG